ncbi:1-phosphatidylinositol 3-phosphate 5-kinase [Phytophthora citrophthora]|uniref:1-phosphatidylinositol 3-phosphate 5-kinase n=1 Tax=Phytophthora citrophthora TaxID=4793 RepID=A0AAD9FYM5_9STRA|nr:1-phosphatidylinositol 3-phosphate 5-kinase [Phytophthora citrophthora]
MSTSLPLPKGFFNTNVHVSEDMRRQYIEFAEGSIRKVFALSDCHKNSWIPMREKKGVAIYRNFGQMRGPKAYKSNVAEVGCKGQLSASLDQVGRAYAAHDDALFKRLMKKLNPAVMDAAVLLTIVPRTPITPFRYIGIKWYAVKTPTPIVSHRDYCCLEVQDKIVDSFGNEMYIRVLNSIEINECPSLENSHGLVRAKILAGYMYRIDRAEPNVVRVHHVARFDPGGYFPAQWAFKTAESQLVNSIVQIRRIIDKQQMNACTFVDKRQWVPNHERLHCAVCSRTFGTFRPRHHCRSCGEVICGKCSVFKSVEVPGTTLKNIRICSVCNMGVQKAGGQDDDGNASDISTSSVTSSSTIAHNEMNLMDLYMANGGGPRTPSAYSDASAQSNLSIRSTTSTRSVSDARGRAHSHARGPRTAGAFFNENNTPRSYIANNLTPRSTPLGFGFGSGASTPRSGANSAATTPSAGARPSISAANVVAAAAITAQRLSNYKQHPVDIGYLRDSVHEAPGSSSTTTGTHERPEDPTTPWPPAKMLRLQTEETDDVDMESDDQEEMESKPAAPLPDEAQQRLFGMQLPTVERISESPFEQSSRAPSTLRASVDKDQPASSTTTTAASTTSGAGGLRPFFSGILSRVRGESVEKSSQRAA